MFTKLLAIYYLIRLIYWLNFSSLKKSCHKLSNGFNSVEHIQINEKVLNAHLNLKS